MVDELAVMIAAVTIAVLLMLVLVGTISRFVDKHPTVKMLAPGTRRSRPAASTTTTKRTSCARCS